MRSGDALRRDVLRMAQNAVYTSRSAISASSTDDDVAAILAREVKTRRESVEAFRKGGREDLAAKEEAEIAILAEYLPEQLAEAEIQALVDEAHRRDRRVARPRPGQGHGLARAADARPRRRQAASPRSSRRPSPAADLVAHDTGGAPSLTAGRC